MTELVMGIRVRVLAAMNAQRSTSVDFVRYARAIAGLLTDKVNHPLNLAWLSEQKRRIFIYTLSRLDTPRISAFSPSLLRGFSEDFSPRFNCLSLKPGETWLAVQVKQTKQDGVGVVESLARNLVDRGAVPRVQDQVFRQTWYLYTYLE